MGEIGAGDKLRPCGFCDLAVSFMGSLSGTGYRAISDHYALTTLGRYAIDGVVRALARLRVSSIASYY
jgi:hypothetical protein